MPNLPALVHDSILSAAITSTVYTATVTTAALTALFTRDPARRRTAQSVLKILLHRNRKKRRNSDLRH